MSRRDETTEEGGVATQPKSRVKVKKPRLFKVVLHNDDYTTLEFVIQILEKLFHHPPAAAAQIMLKIHNKGRGVAGTFSRDIAETKLMQVDKRARQSGHPLKATLEED
jgi:ATP-dependent Clp protease adaptor protein ClpS